MNAKQILILGAAFGMLSVILGAFGAHGLESKLPEWYPLKETQIAKLEVWNTGVRYQMYCALALLATGTIALVQQQSHKLFSASALLFVGGIALFSGSLYILVLADIKIFGMVAAMGGSLQVVAWFVMLIGLLRLKSPKRTG